MPARAGVRCATHVQCDRELSMRLTARLILYLAGSLLLVSVAFSYYQIYREKLSLRAELARKAELLSDSLEESIGPRLCTAGTEPPTAKRSAEPGGCATHAELQQTAERFANKEHLAGIAVYDHGGARLAMSPGLNERLPERPVVLLQSVNQDAAIGGFLRVGPALLHVYAVPLHRGDETAGSLLVVHDATYIR